MRTKECPKCGADITDSYEPDDPSVGIYGGWYCDVCDEAIADEDDDDPFDYERDSKRDNKLIHGLD